MAQKWSDLTATDEFKAMPADRQEVARVSFFDTVIAPQIEDKSRMGNYRSAWDKQTGKKAAPLAKTNGGLTAPPRMTPEEEGGSDFVRGFKNYGPQLKQMGGAIQTISGVATKNLGADDTGDRWIESGVEGMDAAKADIQQKDSDQFTEAWDEGMGVVTTDWLPYQVGQGAANIAEMAVTMLAGAGLGYATAGPVGSVGGGLTGIVGRKLVKDKVLDYAKKLAE